MDWELVVQRDKKLVAQRRQMGWKLVAKDWKMWHKGRRGVGNWWHGRTGKYGTEGLEAGGTEGRERLVAQRDWKLVAERAQKDWKLLAKKDWKLVAQRDGKLVSKALGLQSFMGWCR